ncbi:MAG: RsmE family RNA methyltransferase [Polyangiaceae bacterium]
MPLRVPLAGLEPGERVLDLASSRYLVRVHRTKAGAAFIAFDPAAGLEADATLVDADPRRARVRLGEVRAAAVVAPLAVTLLQALGKGDKAELVVRDATALGVARIVFVETERSVPRVGDRRDAKRERWLEVARQAARQSGRGDVPEIVGPLGLDAALALAAGLAGVVLDPKAGASFATGVSEGSRVLLIGPEGGLTERELALAESSGFRRVRFGRLVLRTETMAVAALGAMLALCDAGSDTVG